MVRYCYIVVEGPQDVEFLIGLLKFYDLKRVIHLSSLDKFWETLIPTAYPLDGDLTKRVPVPSFVQNEQLSIALHSSIGITRIAQTIEESLKFIQVARLFSVGIFADADYRETPQERFNKLITKLSDIDLPNLLPPSQIGQVNNHSTRCGIFIAPNNREQGTLEDILLECAKINYPDLLNLSQTYIESIDRNQLTKNDLEDFKKPAGEKKAIISSISSILRPGKALQVSLQDNRWLDKQTLELESIKLIKNFLEQIIGL
ncbi:DUF3226 domain-containing protein [Microcystis aeruginosa]|uniref:DUF4276 family protein n=1 Tax=Microcystis aeruginosa Ma_QC_C_20070703_M131 TaxID=2486263 RepID=A0A551X3X2_MICAE|nr:DUF3226 domain-containing protein [Microcystis aeruginosa]TRT43404.1 MAG: hypothetical protein EWV85_22170 [Microcystis aeruginosa Ma_QC_C_20070703_M131]